MAASWPHSRAGIVCGAQRLAHVVMTASWVMGAILPVAFAWILAARTAACQASAHPENAPEAILRRRDARGEIGETEGKRRLTERRKMDSVEATISSRKTAANRR